MDLWRNLWIFFLWLIFLVHIFLYLHWIWGFLCNSLYSVWIQENTSQKKLLIWTLFTEWYLKAIIQTHFFISWFSWDVGKLTTSWYFDFLVTMGVHERYYFKRTFNGEKFVIKFLFSLKIFHENIYRGAKGY